MTNVHIELQRVQTWLFSVPYLRAMVGANALLGEVRLLSRPGTPPPARYRPLSRRLRNVTSRDLVGESCAGNRTHGSKGILPTPVLRR